MILAEARQQNIGVVLAHQYLGQIDPPVLRALAANTSIKMASRLEGTDRTVMARDMNTTPDFYPRSDTRLICSICAWRDAISNLDAFPVKFFGSVRGHERVRVGDCSKP